jgi:DHA1 family bicyclomycin/chloramphenicol resistance-like MFS transporter
VSTRRAVVILGALSAFGPLSMDMYLPGLPSLTRDLGASASAGQLTLTSCMPGIAIGQVIAGPLSARAVVRDLFSVTEAARMFSLLMIVTGAGAIVAPLVGVAGPHDALPMALAIAVCGVSALAVDLAFAPRP